MKHRPEESAGIRRWGARFGGVPRRQSAKMLPRWRDGAGPSKTRVPPARRVRAPRRALGDESLRRRLCDSASRPIFRSRRAIDNAGLWHRPGRRSLTPHAGGPSSAIPGAPAGARRWPRFMPSYVVSTAPRFRLAKFRTILVNLRPRTDGSSTRDAFGFRGSFSWPSFCITGLETQTRLPGGCAAFRRMPLPPPIQGNGRRYGFYAPVDRSGVEETYVCHIQEEA